MSDERIDKVPEFSHDIDELTLSRLDLGERYLAIELSKIRKELRWSSETARQSHNMGVAHQEIISKWRRKYESPVMILFWFVGVAVVSAVSSLITRWLGYAG